RRECPALRAPCRRGEPPALPRRDGGALQGPGGRPRRRWAASRLFPRRPIAYALAMRLPVRRLLLLGLQLFACAAFAAPGEPAAEAAKARERWAQSPHGPMLARLLPPTYEASQLPEPDSPGAKLTLRYCVQCHNLANPAMHHAAKWPAVVERMVFRMEGRGNMGRLMAEMMAGVTAPSAEETRAIVAYLQKHAQLPLDPKRYPEVNTPA